MGESQRRSWMWVRKPCQLDSVVIIILDAVEYLPAKSDEFTNGGFCVLRYFAFSEYVARQPLHDAFSAGLD